MTNYFLQDLSSETESFLRPFLRRAARTLRPLAVLMLPDGMQALRERKDRKKLFRSKRKIKS